MTPLTIKQIIHQFYIKHLYLMKGRKYMLPGIDKRTSVCILKAIVLKNIMPSI